ncbi:dihydrodiol dehydrogenase [Streptomyces sp. NPDC059076]|uniref:dihydrodiol dehydrogenase n=1 Tax=unclassified Streptomyces TaxID=2593676 RepID=UPI0036BD9BC9
MSAETPQDAEAALSAEGVVDAEFTVINEFTAVRVSKIRTPNGHRVEIRSLRLGHRIRLDPLALESVTWQSPDVFSHFLDQPFGPGPSPSP